MTGSQHVKIPKQRARGMHRAIMLLTGMMAAAVLLSGCMYPGARDGQNPAAYQEYLVVVQQAVDRYVEAKGVPPLITKNADVSMFEKYPLDFNKLIDFNFLSAIPANAFEKGGWYRYLIFNPEEQTQIKLMDLLSFQQAVDVQKWVDEYYRKSGKYPFGDPINEHFYGLDFAVMNKKVLQIQSVYSRQYLRFVIHDSGQVGIDYAAEIMQLIQKKEDRSFTANQDLRLLLTDSSPFVPVKSFPYVWLNNEPTLSEPLP